MKGRFAKLLPGLFRLLFGEVWEGQLFIFECKNYSLPTDNPTERFFFWNKQVEARQQVERIAKDLGQNPAILKKQFGTNVKWKAIHPVVLNALTLSLRRTPNGTFFYDVSALGRFLRTGTLNEVREIQNAEGFIETSVETKRLWKGPTSTAQDLLREMKYPSQISMEADKYYIARRLLSLSLDSAVMIQEAASKPPDFEPLEMKRSKKKSSGGNKDKTMHRSAAAKGRVKR